MKTKDIRISQAVHESLFDIVHEAKKKTGEAISVNDVLAANLHKITMEAVLAVVAKKKEKEE